MSTICRSVKGGSSIIPVLVGWALAGLCCAQAESDHFVPLPEAESGASGSNPLLEMRDRALADGAQLTPEIPDTITIDNVGGDISYDNEARTITYRSGSSPIAVQTDCGGFMQASAVVVDLKQQTATLNGPVVLYQGDMMIRGREGATYDWQNGNAIVRGVRAKVNGLIIRGSSVESKTDASGKQYLVIHDAYVSTEDAEKPSSWVGTGTLTIYPGDYGSISRLSIAGKESDITVPVLGWFTFTHSLNPREGYLPNFGAKSIWGTYLLNSYGFLLGNTRVEKGMPTADYLLTTHLDYRTRRGAAIGLDIEDIALAKRYKEMQGLKMYGLADASPMISPTEAPRQHTRNNRYRVSLQQEWEGKVADDARGKWKLAGNINAVSDRYTLRDFFENQSRVDNQPDNTIRLTRTDERSQAMLYTRFAPNTYYASDERIEASFYRVRSAIGNTGLSYETNNSATIMRQYLPPEQRAAYRSLLANYRSNELREYYTRLLMTRAYTRVNTTHELTTTLKPLPFLNLTPKAGAGYTGYYDVGGVGSDNRLLGYLGCDLDIKFNYNYRQFAYRPLGLRGLTHVFHPYLSYSQASISSSNPLVPRIDNWSGTTNGSTSSPMPLDFCGFNGLDGWGDWTIVRLGLQNVLNSRVDGERLRLVNWNVFIDYNVDNPNTEAQYSNLYNVLSFAPGERLRFDMESQTPTIRDGYGYHQYNLGATYMPFSWLEGQLGYRSIQDHPILEDASQIYFKANLRIDERNTLYGRWYFDISEKRMPIQEYSYFRNYGAWYVGATLFLRDNGGKREEGFGLSFTLGETGSALPVRFY
ncbi:MAG: hypothetical protein ACI4P8_00195 [Akkermansia sp.]